MARTTTCTPGIEASAWDYIEGGWEAADHAFPSVVGLCDIIDVGRSTIYAWSKRDDNKFLDILEKINEKQELIAFSKGMKNEYNASLVKLLLGKHGYHDKQDTTLGGGDTPVEIDHMWQVNIVG
jgi:hypothetical protein